MIAVLAERAVFGTASGALFTAEVRSTFRGGTCSCNQAVEMKTGISCIDVRRLPSEHRHPIDHIVVHPGGYVFVSIDKDEVCVLWGWPRGKGIKPADYRGCKMCGMDPVYVCSGCGMGLCRECKAEGADSECQFCQALRVM
jgi:hypothetical protein